MQDGEHIKLLFVIKIFVLSILVAVLHRFYCNSSHITAHMIYYLGLHVFCLFGVFDLILYVPSTIFQLNRDGSSWVEPVPNWDKCVLLKDHNAVTPVRLKPAAPRSRVKHSTTEPLRSVGPRCETGYKNSTRPLVITSEV